MACAGQQYGVRDSGGYLRGAPYNQQAILRPFQTLRKPLAKRFEHESSGHVVSGSLKEDSAGIHDIPDVAVNSW